MLTKSGGTYQNLSRAASPRIVGLAVGLFLLPAISEVYGLRGLAFYSALTLMIPLWFTVTDFGKTTVFTFDLKAHFEEKSALIMPLLKSKVLWGILGGQILLFLNLTFQYVPNSMRTYVAFNVILCSSTVGSTLAALLKSVGSQYGDYAEIFLTRVVLLIAVLFRRGSIEELLFYMSALYLLNCLIISNRAMRMVRSRLGGRIGCEFPHQSVEREIPSKNLAPHYLDASRLKAVLSAGALMWVSLILAAMTVRVSEIEADVFLAANRVIQICCLPATVFISAALLSHRDQKSVLDDLKNKMRGGLGITVLVGSITVFVAGNYVAGYLRISEDLHDIFVRSLRIQAIAILPIYYLFLEWADIANSHSTQHEGLTRTRFVLTLFSPLAGIFFPSYSHWLFTSLFLVLLLLRAFDRSQHTIRRSHTRDRFG